MNQLHTPALASISATHTDEALLAALRGDFLQKKINSTVILGAEAQGEKRFGLDQRAAPQ